MKNCLPKLQPIPGVKYNKASIFTVLKKIVVLTISEQKI